MKKNEGMRTKGMRKKIAGILTALSFSLSILPPSSWAEDGAREALQLRYQAERAIAQEQATGHREMAQAMQESLSGLLQEYLVTRDGTVALDTVDDIFVQEQFKTARAAEEPGVALALDVFSGPGTGAENKLRTEMTNLAEFHSDRAEQAVERTADRPAREYEREHLQVTKGTVDAYERQMERQLDKIERTLGKNDSISERLEVKIEARLDAVAERLEKKEVKAAHPSDLTAEKAERKAEKVEEKVEKAAEKTEEKTAEKVEKAAEKAEQKAEKAEDRAAKAAQAQADHDAQRAADQAAADARKKK